MSAASWRAATDELAARLSVAFAEALRWLDADEGVWGARERPRERPPSWSVGEVLEHLVLTHRHLLILCDKLAAKSANRRAEGRRPPDEPPSHAELERLASAGVDWPAPEHMLPAGRATRSEVRAGLERDRARCLALLRSHPEGEGALHTISFSPAGQRLDLYGFLAVIELHLRRHLAQLERAGARAGGPRLS